MASLGRSQTWKSLAKEGGVVALYAILTLGFFWQRVFLPNVHVPVGGGDLASFLYPVYSFAARNLQQGVFPFWNPHLYGGSPFAADMQTGLFYPLNLLAFLLARPFSYETMEALALAHYFLGACFAYAYARTLGLPRLGSFGVGGIFAFSGFAVAHLGHLNMLASAIWLPLILLLFHRALAQRHLSWAFLAGLAYGVSILAGHTQIALYTALFLALYWLWGLGVGWRAMKDNRRSLMKPALALPLIYLAAISASAVQLIPSYELVTHSLRSDLTYAKAIQYAASPLGFITFFVPHFFGDNPAQYWGIRWNLTEVYGYMGIIPWALATLALLLRLRKREWMHFFAVTVVLFFLLSIGEHTVLFGWLYKFVPGFDKVRAAGRFLLFVNFGVALLAGYGLDQLVKRPTWRERPRWRWFLWGLGLLLLGSAFGLVPYFYHALLTNQEKAPIILARSQMALDSLNLSIIFLALGLALLLAHRLFRGAAAMVPYLVVVLLVVDLFSANAGYNPAQGDVTESFQHPEVVRFLKADPEPFRIDSVTNVWDAWQPNTSLLEGIDDVMGIYNPMMLADYDRFWASLGSRSTVAYDLLNAKYVIGHKNVVLDWQRFTPVLTDAPKVNLYRNTKVLPRALVVPQAEVVPREEILTRLKAPAFDPTQVVLLEEGTAVRDGGTQSKPGSIRSLTYPTPNLVHLQVETETPAYLLLNDVMYPGWRASLNGAPTPIYRANYLFRAVALPPGNYRVDFTFEPRRWPWAVGATLFTWLLTPVVLFFAARGGKPGGMEAPP